MQIPRALGPYGYSVRPHAAFHPDYASSACLGTAAKPNPGKSFTIDALLAKPDHNEKNRASPHQGSVSPAQSPLGVYLHAGQMCAPLPQYLYNTAMMHTQTSYPAYYCPPYGYQTACAGTIYSPGEHSQLLKNKLNEIVDLWLQWLISYGSRFYRCSIEQTRHPLSL